MLIWGGKSTSTYKNGGVYNPLTNEWETSWAPNLRSGSLANTPVARSKHLAIYTGGADLGTELWRNKMLIWGGESGGTTGGFYDIAGDDWTVMTTTNAPSQRWGFSYVHTITGTATALYHNKLIVWGGENGITRLSDGATYDPKANSWTTLSTINAPPIRKYHTAVWTGSKMLVWGGDGVSTSGGIYDPYYGTWGPTTTIYAPPARLYHSAVWTGSEMIIWGGGDGSNFYNTGGRYKYE